MEFVILAIVGCLSGFVLFSRTIIKRDTSPFRRNCKVSVIIPARNEEKNLSHILSSLESQTYKPFEIIVVDDFSSDATSEIARQHKVKVVKNTDIPAGWTGKNWAVWNGFLHSSGDVLVFLDADVRLEPDALECLLKTREQSGGVISVVPYHHTEKFYERLALVTNILGIFAFTSPFERQSREKGLYGSCIVATREDYEKINGHRSIRSEIMDDLNLGKRFSQAGVNIENFIGYGLVSFRMYPHGIVSEIQGFAKGAVLGAVNLQFTTVFFIILWVLGLTAAGILAPVLLLVKPAWSGAFVIGYILYTVQILYFMKYVGKFGITIPILHFLSSLFFVLITLYSAYQVKFLGYVSWKGRHVEIGGRRSI